MGRKIVIVASNRGGILPKPTEAHYANISSRSFQPNTIWRGDTTRSDRHGPREPTPIRPRRSLGCARTHRRPSRARPRCIPAAAQAELRDVLRPGDRQRSDGLALHLRGQQQFQVDGVRSGQFFTVNNTVAGAAITNISMTFWLATVAGTTWTRVAGSSACWSVPAATGATTTFDGQTFRAYTSDFSCPAVPTGSSYTIPTAQMFNFVSSCQGRTTLPTRYYHYTQAATTRGVPLTKDNGWNNQMV